MEQDHDGVFTPLIGHNGAKAILRGALQRGDVHLLLSGPPASGKSVALLAIEEAIDSATYVDAAGFTERKLRDTLADNPPALLVDEFDNMKPDVFRALNTALEQGRVTKQVTGDSYDEEINTQVIVACNHPEDLPGDVADRFVQVAFDPYTREEYIDVCEILLPRQVEWVAETDDPGGAARHIAKTVWDKTDANSPRTARDAARLAASPGRVAAIVRAMNDPKADVDSDPITPDDLPHSEWGDDSESNTQRPTSLDEVRERMADPDELESRPIEEVRAILGTSDDNTDDEQGDEPDTTDDAPAAEESPGAMPTVDDSGDDDATVDLDIDSGYDSGIEYLNDMIESGNRALPASTPQSTVGVIFPEESTDIMYKLVNSHQLDPGAPDPLTHTPKTIREEFGEDVAEDLNIIQFQVADVEDIRSTGYDINAIVDAIANEPVLVNISSTVRWTPNL
jgi:hypothetical protein